MWVGGCSGARDRPCRSMRRARRVRAPHLPWLARTANHRQPLRHSGRPRCAPKPRPHSPTQRPGWAPTLPGGHAVPSGTAGQALVGVGHPRQGLENQQMTATHSPDLGERREASGQRRGTEGQQGAQRDSNVQSPRQPLGKGAVEALARPAESQEGGRPQAGGGSRGVTTA